MTRYRLKTQRAIILFLQEEGPSSVPEIARWLGKEPRVIYNYLRYYKDVFEVRGMKWGLRR